MNQPQNTQITAVMTIGVPVSDQDRALEFYVNTLGLEKRRDAPIPQLGGRWIEVAPTDAAVTIALVPAREGTPTGVDTGIRLKTGDAAAAHANLRQSARTLASSCDGRASRPCSTSTTRTATASR